jgi:hypothetical protein
VVAAAGILTILAIPVVVEALGVYCTLLHTQLHQDQVIQLQWDQVAQVAHQQEVMEAMEITAYLPH